jgi:glycosyltransferase involved in cell wall biosynthesis
VRVALLDLAGETRLAREWVERLAPGSDVVPVDKAELKGGSKRDALARVRASGPYDLFAVFCHSLEMQPGRALMLAFGLAAGARRAAIGDLSGRSVERSPLQILFVDLPRLALELAAGYGLVVPLAWIVTWWLRAKGRRRPRAIPRGDALDLLYLRATPAAGAAVGGSTSHIAGVVSALGALGHRVRFVANDRLPSVDHDRMPVEVVSPSATFTTPRAIFEIWNGLVFMRAAMREARRRPPDAVYQRYNRFTWAGVAVAREIGRPLVLEFNGSEVWVAEHWDPVGQRRLLAAVERLNLAAADRVVVVSEVLARDVERMGFERSRIVVNPNGADPERFRPGAGGAGVRERLGIGSAGGAGAPVVAGFVGTFGPWHGVEVLGDAIARLASDERMLFLLVGDGDLRPRVERRVEEAGGRAVFAGRVAHDEIPAWLDACDILVSPHVEMPDGSQFFGSPTKLFEYMAAGRAIVASRLGQIGDVLEDERTALLVEPGSVDALVAAVERLAGDPDLRASLGRAAREAAIADFTWRRNAERVVSAIENSADSRG